jgi:hypothetical protein
MKLAYLLGGTTALVAFAAWTNAFAVQPDALATDQAVFKTLTAQVSIDKGTQVKGNNGVGNGLDPAPPGNPPPNDGPGTGPGNPGNKPPKP